MPSKPKRDVPMLSDAEEAALQAQIANDPDAAEATDEQLAQMRPAKDVLPPAVYKTLTKRGRPKVAAPKELLTLRLPPAVVEAYRATGKGWQTRMGDVLAKGASVTFKETNRSGSYKYVVHAKGASDSGAYEIVGPRGGEKAPKPKHGKKRA